MRFAIRMAWRESRAAWRHFAAVLASIALGVAALVAVGSFAADIDRALGREGRTLAGGDLELRSSRPLGAAAEAALARLAVARATVTTIRELAGMARDGDHGASLLVEVKAVDDAYPLYGRVETEPARPLAELLAGDGAVVERSLLTRLGLRPGDRLLVGGGTFTIRGVLAREPDRPASAFALGPRVLLGARSLDSTALVQTGSRVRYRALVRLPDPRAAAATRAILARELDDPAVRVTAFDESQPGLRRFFSQLSTYLGLVGLVSLLVGGVGVAAAVRAFIRKKRESVAILKALGAGSRLLLATYVLQAQALGLAGSLLGAALGTAVAPVVARLLAGLLPFTLDGRSDPGTLVRGVAMGTVMTLLAALWPLLEVRDVPPSLVLRRDVDATRRGRRPWLATLPIAAGLAALCVWQAGSFKVGGIFVAAAVVAVALLAALARALVGLAGAVPRLPSLAWRQGVANLHRPGGHATGVVVALGIGVMLLVAVGLLEAGIDRQIDHERRTETPSFFFIDIQADQREAFARTVRETGGVEPALIPVVRSRLAAVNGVPVTRALLERRRAEGHDALWYFTRDYVLTWAPAAPPTNVLTRGRWWTAAEAAERPRVSVEEEAARRLGVDVGGTLGFDVQGVRVEAQVMSVRRVDWQSLSTNFFMIVSPGALDGAPATYVGTARVPAAAETRLQDAVVAAFPNVAVIPVRDVLARVATVLDQIAFAVRSMALFSIGAGLAVMAGTLAASRYQRLGESVILRTLGATRGAVARIFAVEYVCLGAAAGLGGSALAAALAWAVLRFVLDVPWQLDVHSLALGVVVAMAVSLAVGSLGTFRLLGEKPLPVLRRE